MSWRMVLATSFALLTLALMTVASVAQKGEPAFDGRKFFEELNKRGVDTKGVDGKAFFDELAGRGMSAKAPVDVNKFIGELRTRGVAIGDIDGNRLFGEMRERGVLMPDMLLINRDPPKNPD